MPRVRPSKVKITAFSFFVKIHQASLLVLRQQSLESLHLCPGHKLVREFYPENDIHCHAITVDTGIYSVAFIGHDRKKRKTHSPLVLEKVVVRATNYCSQEWEDPPPGPESTVAPGKAKGQSARVLCALCVDGERGGQRDGWTRA